MVSREILQKKFKVFIFLSLFVLLIEVAGGVFANSLALLSDAGHVLVDLLALLLAYFSIWLSRKAPTKKFTFGLYRAEILAAIINGGILIFVVFYIFYQSFVRFLSPQPIKELEMISVATIGFLANLYVAMKMRSYAKENLNVRGAYLHVLGDTLSSVGVVVAGILIAITGYYIFDLVASVMIGVFILIHSFRLIKESTLILLEATPAIINLEEISKDIKKIKGIKEVHDLHVWNISSDACALSAHIVISADDVKFINQIISEINRVIKLKYNITHTVIQSECEGCVEEEHSH